MLPLTAALPPVKIVLSGKYWDTQLYSGTLLLFGLDGSLVRLDWDRFVASLPLPEELRLVAEAAFLGSDRFYGPDMRRLIQDPEVKPIMVDKFRRLQHATDNMRFEPNPLGVRTDNPLPFPHNDSDFHYGSLYVAARSGIFQLVGDGGSFRKRASRRLTDVPTLDIAAKYRTIAVAAGDAGLFEIRLQKDETHDLRPVAPNMCNTCEWTYASLVCSNQAHQLFLAAFYRVPERILYGEGRSRRMIREFETVVPQETLFASFGTNLSGAAIHWGAKDKIYRYTHRGIDMLQNTVNAWGTFKPLGSRAISAPLDLSKFVAVRVAPFGSVIEFDDRVEVLLSSGEILTYPGEPVNWRVFPRSLNYLNQLHLIYDDRIEIVAFTSDYFTAPDERFFGTEPISMDERF